MYEYKVIKDFYLQEWGQHFVSGETYTDGDFPEPDIPANLVSRGVLEPADMKAEALRLKPDAVKAKEPKEGKF